MYWREHKIDVVAPAQARKLSFGRSKVDAMADTLVTSNPTVKRYPTKRGDLSDSRADEVEKWAEGLLREASLNEMVPPFKTAAKYIALLGYTVLKQRWDNTVWPKKPRKGAKQGRFDDYERIRSMAFPFAIECPHPARVLMPHNERNPSMAIETSTAFIFDLKRQYPEQASEFVGRPYDMLEVIHYWDYDWQIILVQGRELLVLPNEWGFIPYTHAFSGYGQERAPTYQATQSGVASGRGVPPMGPKPEDMAVGLLRSVRDTIMSMDEFYSAMHYLALNQAYRVKYTTGDPEELAQALSDAEAGGVVPTGGAQITEEAPPRVDRWAFQVHAMAQADLNQSTFASEVQGQRSPGVTTATQHALMLGTSRQKFDVPLIQLNQMANQALGYCAKMVVARNESVTIDGVTITPEHFEKNFDFEVKFESKDEGALLREREVGMREVQSGLRSPETYWEKTGISDAVGEARKIFVAQMMQSDIIRQEIENWVLGSFRENRQKQQPQNGGLAQNGGPGRNLTPFQAPQSFIPQPGGPQEAGLTQRQMVQTPGTPLARP